MWTPNQATLDVLSREVTTYAEEDPAALRELRSRILRIGRTANDHVYYSELVDGVAFNVPSVNWAARRIGRDGWTELVRGVLSQFLCKLSVDSYRDSAVLLSALVVARPKPRERTMPGKGFFNFARRVKLFGWPSDSYEFWQFERHKALEYCKRAGGVLVPHP